LIIEYNIAKKVLELCNRSEDFDVIELRKNQENETVSDIVVVDCVNDFVPVVNKHNIKRRERLALVFNKDKYSEVRALRKDFPKVPIRIMSLPESLHRSACTLNHGVQLSGSGRHKTHLDLLCHASALRVVS
jgi:hypothetical protein